MPDGASNDYLRPQPPAWTALQGGLSIFAAIVILHICVRRLRRRRARAARSGQEHLNSPNAATWTEPNEKGQTASSEAKQGIPDQPQYTPETMSGNPRGNGSPEGGGMRAQHINFGGDGMHMPGQRAPIDLPWNAGDGGVPRNLIARPPPAPPLTPPELSSTVFTLQARPHGEDSIIHQPNPDYTSQSGNSDEPYRQSTVRANSHPRRFSYNKTVPIGMPASRMSSTSESDSDLYFSPSSYPPAAPILPPAPSSAMSRPSSGGQSLDAREIELHGEIVAVVDQNGAGWSRHTRVYGGGACLACAAAGRQHGEGGFYGPNVLPEEMR